MKRLLLSSLLLATTALSPAAHAVDVPLPDPGWGTGGTGNLYVGFDLGGNLADRAMSGVLLADGRLVVAGDVVANAQGQRDIGITRRLRANGAPDPTFGGATGKVTAGIVPSVASRVARGINGTLWYSALQSGSSGLVGRVNENGSADTSFDSNGWRTLEASIFLDGASEIQVSPRIVALPDGKAIVMTAVYRSAAPARGCIALVRLNASGGIDPGFAAGSGRTCEAPPSDGLVAATGYELLHLADGRLLVVGAAFRGSGENADMAVLRLSAEGVRDTTFGEQGWAFVAFDAGGFNDDLAVSAAVDAGGRILIAGSANIAGAEPSIAAVARLTANGQLDTSFGIGGRVQINRSPAQFPGSSTNAYSVIALEDSRVLVAGRNFSGNDEGFVVGLRANGSYDTNFGSVGGFYYAFNGSIGQLLRDGDYLYLLGSTSPTTMPVNIEFLVRRRLLPLFHGGFD